MSSVPISRVQDQRKLALQRCCGVCRHFWGTALASDGNCTRHNKPTSGRKGAAACEQWERRREGLDPVPWQLPEKIFGIKATAVIIDDVVIIDESADVPRSFFEEPVNLPAELSTRPGSARPRGSQKDGTQERRRKRLRDLLMKLGPFTAEELANQTGETVELVIADADAIGMRLGEAAHARMPSKPAAPVKVTTPRAASPKPERVRTFVVNEELEARRNRLRAFIAERGSVTAREATAALKSPTWQIRSDAAACGIVLAPAPSKYSPDVRDLRERVKQAFDGKRTIREIADVVGAHVRTVSGHLDALEIEAPKGTPGPGGKPEERALIEARQARVKELVEAREHSRTQIAALLDISERTLQSDMAMIGIALPTGRPWRRGKKTAAERAATGDVAELVAPAPGEPLEAMLARGAEMIRIARQTSSQLNALALEIERWIEERN